jgi:hypothetical protein
MPPWRPGGARRAAADLFYHLLHAHPEAGGESLLWLPRGAACIDRRPAGPRACLKCRLSWHRMGRAAAARPSSSSQTSMQQQRAEQQPCACAAIRTWHIILPAQRPALPYNSNSISKQQQQNDS